MAHLVLFINLGNIKSVANHKISTHFPLFCDFQVTCHALYDVMWPLCLSIAKIGEKMTSFQFCGAFFNWDCVHGFDFLEGKTFFGTKNLDTVCILFGRRLMSGLDRAIWLALLLPAAFVTLLAPPLSDSLRSIPAGSPPTVRHPGRLNSSQQTPTRPSCRALLGRHPPPHSVRQLQPERMQFKSPPQKHGCAHETSIWPVGLGPFICQLRSPASSLLAMRPRTPRSYISRLAGGFYM